MRNWGISILLLAGACQQQKQAEQAPAKPPETTFDGAQVTDAGTRVAHGDRLTHTLGCRGCHRDQLEGGEFYERYASNLTRELPKYSDAEIEKLLRTGVPRDGRVLYGMPSEIFQHLSAADMTALIAELRTLKPGGKPTQPPKPWTKETRDLMVKGVVKPVTEFVAEAKDVYPVDLGPDRALGRYITSVTCAECHGPKLEGQDKFTPNLVAAGGYTREQFETLMTKGVAANGRKLKNPLMGEVARERFSHFTPHERDELYAYLKARAEKAK
jgi:mono/diheme cytochrome c family protein